MHYEIAYTADIKFLAVAIALTVMYAMIRRL